MLADVYTYPNDVETSAWASVAIGYGGMLVLAARQLCCGSSAARTAVTPAANADLASAIGSTPAAGSAPLRMLHGYLVAFLVVNCWRGVWFLLDSHVLVDNMEASAWLTHDIGVSWYRANASGGLPGTNEGTLSPDKLVENTNESLLVRGAETPKTKRPPSRARQKQNQATTESYKNQNRKWKPNPMSP